MHTAILAIEVQWILYPQKILHVVKDIGHRIVRVAMVLESPINQCHLHIISADAVRSHIRDMTVGMRVSWTLTGVSWCVEQWNRSRLLKYMVSWKPKYVLNITISEFLIPFTKHGRWSGLNFWEGPDFLRESRLWFRWLTFWSGIYLINVMQITILEPSFSET